MKQNPRAFHRYVNANKNSRESLPSMRKEDGTFTESNLEDAQALLQFFKSVHVDEYDRDLLNVRQFFDIHEEKNHMPHNYYGVTPENTMEEVTIVEQEVKKVLGGHK